MHQTVHIFQFVPAGKHETRANSFASLPFSSTVFVKAHFHIISAQNGHPHSAFAPCIVYQNCLDFQGESGAANSLAHTPSRSEVVCVDADAMERKREEIIVLIYAYLDILVYEMQN